jgi:hypothetical protein
MKLLVRMRRKRTPYPLLFFELREGEGIIFHAFVEKFISNWKAKLAAHASLVSVRSERAVFLDQRFEVREDYNLDLIIDRVFEYSHRPVPRLATDTIPVSSSSPANSTAKEGLAARSLSPPSRRGLLDSPAHVMPRRRSQPTLLVVNSAVPRKKANDRQGEAARSPRAPDARLEEGSAE